MLTFGTKTITDYIPERLNDIGKTDIPIAFVDKSPDNPPVFFLDVVQLRSELAWQFHALLDGRIRLESFTSDLIKKVGTTTQELGMCELPSLPIGICTLCSRCLRNKVVQNVSK